MPDCNLPAENCHCHEVIVAGSWLPSSLGLSRARRQPLKRVLLPCQLFFSLGRNLVMQYYSALKLQGMHYLGVV
jgi:hypothetical protein